MTKLTNDMKKRAIDVPAIKRIESVAHLISQGQVVAYVMHHCGATYQQIADVFGVTRSASHQSVETTKRTIKEVTKK